MVIGHREIRQKLSFVISHLIIINFGEQLKTMLESLATNQGRYDKTHYQTSFVERFSLFNETRKAQIAEVVEQLKRTEAVTVRLSFVDQHGMLRGKVPGNISGASHSS